MDELECLSSPLTALTRRGVPQTGQATAEGWPATRHRFDGRFAHPLSPAYRFARLEGHSAPTWGVAFSREDPDLLASCSDDGTVRLWDVARGLNVATFEEFEEFSATSVAFAAGHAAAPRLLAGGNAGEAVMLDLSYYDRHIVGNLDHQLARTRGELGVQIDLAALQAWKSEVLRRTE